MARDFQAAHDLILYGESHVGKERKARFFAKLINARHVQYHASEAFLNIQSFGDKVEKYLEGKITKSGLPLLVRGLSAILDAIKRDVQHRGLVFAGTKLKGLSRRNEGIYANFKSSYNLHIKTGRFSNTHKGHFHIGADHGSRLPIVGASKTTTQRLIADGFNCGIVRILTEGYQEHESEDTTFKYGGKEHVIKGEITRYYEISKVKPLSGGEESIFELLPILRKVGGGNAFGADLQIKGNPFFKIKPAEAVGSTSYAQFYDKLIYLP